MKPSERNATPSLSAEIAAALPGASVALLLVWRSISATEGAVLGYGLWSAQFSIAALVLWGVCCWWRGAWSLRFGKIDVAVGLFFAGHLLSGAWALSGEANQRATINMLCEWSGLAATYVLLRQTLITHEIRRQIVVIMLATVTALSVYGLWQHYVWYPQTAEEYRQLRRELDEALAPPAGQAESTRIRQLQGELMSMGVPATALEGRGRESYEARLLSSTEPLGRFALANTFAGLLVAWWTVLTALVIARGLNPQGSPATIAATLFGVGLMGLIGFCLLLTKSRTAYVGTLAGLGAIGMLVLAARAKLTRRALLIGSLALFAIGGMIGVAALTGGLDRWVVSEAPKSLRYRWEYWNGTWEVIKERPIVGVGPGNFRSYYLQHKLPQSSEEISDPHNLLLDVWVNGGLLALGGLIAIAVIGVRAGFGGQNRSVDRESEENRPAQVKTRPDEAKRRPGTILIPIPAATGCGAFVAIFCVAFYDANPATWGLLLAWCLAMPLCRRAVGEARLDTRVFLAGIAALAVHLLGAGGIGMPAICQSLLLLLVLSLPVDPAQSITDRSSKRAVMTVLLIGLALCAGCWQFGTRPVFERETALAEVDLTTLRPGDIERVLEAYRRAARSDPYSSEPHRKLAELEFGLWSVSTTPNAELIGSATKMLRKSLEKNPRSWTDFRTLGEYSFQHFQQSGDRDAVDLSVNSLRRAIRLYPNQSETRAKLAEVLSDAGFPEDAALEAAAAIKLNEITKQAGHQDRLLPLETLKLLQRIANQSPQDVDPAGQN